MTATQDGADASELLEPLQHVGDNNPAGSQNVRLNQNQTPNTTQPIHPNRSLRTLAMNNPTEKRERERERGRKKERKKSRAKARTKKAKERQSKSECARERGSEKTKEAMD